MMKPCQYHSTSQVANMTKINAILSKRALVIGTKLWPLYMLIA